MFYVYAAVCYYLFVCVCEHNVWGELSQTPSACTADRHAGLCACAVGFVYLRTTERQQQLHWRISETQNNCAFDGVCLWQSLDRKWDHAEGSVCAQSLSKSRARPGGEYESLINRPRWAYGNEEQFIQCDVSKLGGICGCTEQNHPPAFTLSLFSSTNLSYCLKVSLWNSSYRSDHSSQHNSPFLHT